MLAGYVPSRKFGPFFFGNLSCGKRATAKEKFCFACGGEIKLKEKPPVIEPTEAEASAEAEVAVTEA